MTPPPGTGSDVVLRGAQVAGGGGTSSQPQLEIFSLNRSSPRLVKTVATRADVLCLEYVREERGGAAATPGNIICAGLQDGRSVHSRSFRTNSQWLDGRGGDGLQMDLNGLCYLGH